MKMENEITATKAGTVQEIHVAEGTAVSEGDILLVIK
jgi:biotin carboxyl carrier protein